MTTQLLLRPTEVLDAIITPESDGNVCVYCEKPIVQGRFHWTDEHGEPRRNDAMYGGGIMDFPSWRHADGTEGHGVTRFGEFDHGVILPKYRCPQCQAFDTVDQKDTGYGSLCNCTACGWHAYYDRGD